jgi:hypothetical protein
MKQRNKWLIGIGVFIVFVVSGIGITYSLWSKTFSQTGENKLVSDCFHITFQEVSGSSITLENAYPIVDEEGKKLTPYEFSITNQCSVPVEYQINFETTKETTMKEEYVKLMFQEMEPKLVTDYERVDVTLKNGKNAYLIEQGYLDKEESKNYKVRIWMDERVTQHDEGAMNSILESKITVIGKYLTKYVEPILNGTDPVVKEGLIPVVISDNGVVKKAYENQEWYRYADKKWANAVILNDESKTYESGEVIPEENIESYFVWIPKYRYQLWDLGEYNSLTEVDNSKPHEIPIIFGDYDTRDSINGECTTPMLSGESGNCEVGDYMTHPAFISMNATGLWVGKFETGYKGSYDKTSAESNTIESEKVQIKPNVNSWRNIQPSNAFYTSYDYKRDFDSHMMKNTEWGAVSYLSHSKYGSTNNVRINNNSDYKTGYSAVVEPTCGYTGKNEECNQYGNTEDITKSWNTSVGYLGSTTGNISGIYDMSGGSWEYVMGVMVDQNGKPISGRNNKNNSGFNGTFSCPSCDSDTSGLLSLTTGIDYPLDNKYYDTYNYFESDKNYKNRILGDATAELGPFFNDVSSWYDGKANFVWNYSPWFHRGGNINFGKNSSIFLFYAVSGIKWDDPSYRIVLSVK